MRFGRGGQWVFELFRGGTFVIDGVSGYAWQKSDSYRDSAIIRSAHPLGETYRVRVEVGEIEYDLDNVRGLGRDSEYDEGPLNENGCYLLAITDEAPTGHYTNDWWHQHRKVVIDVDNNAWGSGMPNPIFMVYFDRSNELMAFRGDTDQWTHSWQRAVQYQKGAWYQVEMEKTAGEYILTIFDRNGHLLKRGSVPRQSVWHADTHPDYLVVGDPHENYYQGSMKVRSIVIGPANDS